MSKTPADGEKEPEPASGLGWLLLLAICCAGAPLLTAGGAGVLAGLFTDTGIALLVGLALMVLGAGLLWRRWHR